MRRDGARKSLRVRAYVYLVLVTPSLTLVCFYLYSRDKSDNTWRIIYLLRSYKKGH